MRVGLAVRYFLNLFGTHSCVVDVHNSCGML